MKIIKKDLKKGSLTLKIENGDDLWSLSQIIEPGDLISGSTERKIKIGGEGGDRNTKIDKKWVFLKITAEKIELTDQLRILGIIVDGPEDVPRGDHHSFKIDIGTIFTIEKEWMNYQLEKLQEKGISQNIILLVFDRDEAHFARLKGQGYELLTSIKGDVEKKEKQHTSKNNYYEEIIKVTKNFKPDQLVIASPGFWTENLVKVLPAELKKKTISASISQVSVKAFNEVLKRPELKSVLEKSRATREIKITEKILEMISKDKACYGIKDCREKVKMGAVEELVVTFNLLQKKREEEKFHEIEKIMKECEKNSGKVHVLSTEDASKTIDSLTGIAGILRW